MSARSPQFSNTLHPVWLAFDIGNSAIKGGVFEEDRLCDAFSLPHDPSDMESGLDGALRRMPAAAHPAHRVGVASVVPDSETCLVRLLEDRGLVPVHIDAAMRLPFRLNMAHPETLGADRLAAAAAAWSEYGVSGRRHVIVVDAGSAVTCEVIRRDGVYVGGAIGPGPELALQALRQGTAQLPAVAPAWPPALVGRSTAEAMQSGVMYGFVEGVRGLLRRVRDALPGKAFVVVTGGWRRLLAQEVPEIDRADDDLALKGVRQLMALNEADAAS